MATVAPAVYGHITKDPEICGGKACIDNTRVRVVDIVYLLKEGHSPEQMLREYPSLTLAQVHAALSYYYDHPDEIEASIAADEGWRERHERAKAEYLSRRG